MVDALTLEQRGIPVAVIATDKLVATAGKAMARARGVPDYRFALVEHPIDSARDEDELRVKAEQALPQVIELLTADV